MFQFFIGNISARVKIKTGFFNQPFQEPADDWTFAVVILGIAAARFWFTTSEERKKKNAHFAVNDHSSIIRLIPEVEETDAKKSILDTRYLEHSCPMKALYFYFIIQTLCANITLVICTAS